MQLSEYLHDTIGRLLPLTESGYYFTALCPFHKEETPSFSVNPQNNTYHCFGCDAHGHADDFEMEFSAARRNAP